MRVLIAVASRHGSTRQIAQGLADALAGEGLEPEVAEPEQVSSLDGYTAALLGSAVYLGRWLLPARQLAGRLGAEFKTRPVWLFSSGPLGDPQKPTEEAADVALAMAATGAREHRVFGGRIERGRLSFAERAVVAALRVPDQDIRDWDEIAAWAREIAAALKSPEAAAAA